MKLQTIDIFLNMKTARLSKAKSRAGAFVCVAKLSDKTTSEIFTNFKIARERLTSRGYKVLTGK